MICNSPKPSKNYERLESVSVDTKEDLWAGDAWLPQLFPTENDYSVMIQSTFFQLFPKEESFKSSLFNSGERSVWNFIAHSIVAFVKDRMSAPPSASLGQEMFWPGSQSEILQDLKSCGNPPRSCQKNIAKDILFEPLNYKFLVMSKPEILSEIFDEEHEKEMKAVYRKLYKLTDRGERYVLLGIDSV